MRNYASVKRRPPAVVAKGVPIPPPTGGWDAISPLPNMPADRAVQLDNWVPRPGWVEPRKGYRQWSTGVGTGPTSSVDTVMAYNASATPQNYLFAVANGTIYDCTANGSAVPTIITGLGSNALQYIQFSNPASQFLIAVNGVNPPMLFDGVNWSTGGITGTDVDQNSFSQVNAHNGRLWFVQKNTTKPVYMQDVNAISGTAVVFDLGQFMTSGGYVVAIGTWTVDTRQNVDEYIAFITSRGEVIVYQGTDPSTAETWSLVGRYQVGRPVSERCFCRISGDLLIITVDGVIGMSQMLSTDRAAANRVSLTSTIMNAMSTAAFLYNQHFGWQIIEFAFGTLFFINVPVVEHNTAHQYVMNTITGAWARFTGINANNWAVDFVDNIYFGDNTGTVYQWNFGSSDFGTPIECRLQTAYNSFGNAPQRKRYTACQPLIFSDGTPTVSVGINVDFTDVDTLSTETPRSGTTNNWIGVNGMGYYVSIVCEMTLDFPFTTVAAQLNGWNLTAESGAFV